MKKGSLGDPAPLFGLIPLSEPRIALVGNPAGYPMLFGRNRHFRRIYRTESSAEFARVERDTAVGKRKQRVILANADVAAGVEFRAALTHQNVAGDNFLSAELLHAKATAC